MTQEQNLVQWVYASKSQQELRNRYDQWAKTYETDLDQDFGWIGPLRAVEMGVEVGMLSRMRCS